MLHILYSLAGSTTQQAATFQAFWIITALQVDSSSRDRSIPRSVWNGIWCIVIMANVQPFRAKATIISQKLLVFNASLSVKSYP